MNKCNGEKLQEWMKNNPHSGRLFNDDRAGGYLAFMNPQDSTFIDGRFILKTADFFERYLAFREAMYLYSIPINETFCLTEIHEHGPQYAEYLKKHLRGAYYALYSFRASIT